MDIDNGVFPKEALYIKSSIAHGVDHIDMVLISRILLHFTVFYRFFRDKQSYQLFHKDVTIQHLM